MGVGRGVWEDCLCRNHGSRFLLPSHKGKIHSTGSVRGPQNLLPIKSSSKIKINSQVLHKGTDDKALVAMCTLSGPLKKFFFFWIYSPGVKSD